VDDVGLEVCYERTDVFVLATRHETYGMAVAEALAHGVPVVSTATGAIPDLVGRDAGIVVPVGDVKALTEALSNVRLDRWRRAQLAVGARKVRDRLRSWDDASATMAAALESVAHDA